MTESLATLFPGKMGRVELTRVAIKLRRPDLLKMKPDTQLDEQLFNALKEAISTVRKG